MQSIWDELVPNAVNYCDNNIVEVLFDSKPIGPNITASDAIGRLEISVDVFPFDELDVQGATIHRRLTAQAAFVFGFPAREFLVGQMIKDIRVYPNIIRFDLITTSSLLRFECDAYSIDDVPVFT